MSVSRSSIEWTDSTWSPVTGCDKVSPGCDHCYAETLAHRFAGTKAYPNGFAVTLRPERLDQPLRWRKPRLVFVNSMSDLFHPQIPEGYIRRVFEVMALAKRHTFQVLTKRPGPMRSMLQRWERQRRPNGTSPLDFMPWPLPNVWLGVSAEDQKRAELGSRSCWRHRQRSGSFPLNRCWVR
jgi:protein gp37